MDMKSGTSSSISNSRTGSVALSARLGHWNHAMVSLSKRVHDTWREEASGELDTIGGFVSDEESSRAGQRQASQRFEGGRKARL